MKNTFYIVIFVLAIIFYWFQIRPANIRKDCGEQALMFAQNYDSPRYEPVYQGCLHEKGLK